MQNSQNW